MVVPSSGPGGAAHARSEEDLAGYAAGIGTNSGAHVGMGERSEEAGDGNSSHPLELWLCTVGDLKTVLS